MSEESEAEERRKREELEEKVRRALQRDADDAPTGD